jgi:hypothetical protein
MRWLALVFSMSALSPSGVAHAQIRVNPTGVNVNAQGATSVFLTFGGLGPSYVAAEAMWCGVLLPAAPDVGSKCAPNTIFGRLPLRYDLSRANVGSFTDIMSIPPSVSRRAYQAASVGDNSAFFYVRRFVSTAGGRDQYVAVTCRMAGGGARVPLSLTDVRLAFDVEAPVLFIDAGTVPPPVSAEITYTGTGRLVGRWEIVQPGDEPPDSRDLLPEASLPPDERGLPRRYAQLERFNIFLPPTGTYTLKGPDASRLPTRLEGSYQVLLRIEASDDKEGDSNLGAAGAGTGVVHSGAVAGFSIPALRYVVGTGGSELSESRSPNGIRLLVPLANARLEANVGVDFTWTEVARAGLYELQIEAADGTHVVLNAVLPRGVLRYSAPPWLVERAGGAALRWRIVARDAGGGAVVRSAWRSLGADPRH